MDIVRVASIAAAECVRQQVGLYELGQLIKAYENVHAAPQYFTEMPSDFERIAAIVEPHKNRYGFRKTPVTFANGGSSANAQEIFRLVSRLCADINMLGGPDLMIGNENGSDLVDTIVKEFLWIHPFGDGNGRVGWILYNYLRGTMDSPDPLPDYFGEINV